MKKINFILFIFVAISNSFAQEFVMQGMQHVYQSSYSNPAAIPDQKVSFSVVTGSILQGSLISPITIKDLTADGKSEINQKSLERALSSSNNLFGITNSFELMHVRAKFKTTYISFDINSILNFYMFLPKDLSKLTSGNINPDFTGRTIDLSSFGLSFMHYNQYALGFAREGKKLNIGVRAKFLQGLANANIDAKSAKLDFSDPRNMYDISLNAEGTFQTSTANFTTGDNAGSALAKYYGNMNNLGFATDLGLTYKITKGLHVNLSANNIGFITWRSNTNTYDLSSGTIKFGGIDIGRQLFAGNTLAGNNITDSISKKLTPKSNSNQAYTTFLIPNFYLSGRYYITPRVDMSLTLFAMNYRKLFFGGSVGAQVKLGRIFSLSGNVSYMYSSLMTGAGLMVKLACFQFYGALDNIYLSGAPLSNDSSNPASNIYIPVDQRMVNIRTGMNWVFGRNALNQKQPFDKD
ncbi:MAG: DUF5723 family protein [Bacteroidota bacterium]|nr:DUF5723 family protein [Bacteroidota bacterium]